MMKAFSPKDTKSKYVFQLVIILTHALNIFLLIVH